MRAVIIASAPETDIDYVRELIDENTLVICADGGQRHARALGIVPDLVIGDFDSGSAPESGDVLRLKPEKDDSDLQCCMRTAIERGCDEVILTCASRATSSGSARTTGTGSPGSWRTATT